MSGCARVLACNHATQPFGGGLRDTPRGIGCLTVLGISAGHVVVGLDGIQGRADNRLETFDAGTRLTRQVSADLRAGRGDGVERPQRIAEHQVDIERATRLIEGPEGFGAIGVERGQVRERRAWEIATHEAPLIERAQQRERLKACLFQRRAQIGRRCPAAGGAGASGHDAP